MVYAHLILVNLGDFGQILGPSSVLFRGCCGVRFCAPEVGGGSRARGARAARAKKIHQPSSDIIIEIVDECTETVKH
jgi:hypothetical protein